MLAVGGCRSRGVEEPPPEKPGVTVSAFLYQPTIHAILVIDGGYGTRKSAEPMVTEWRREGSGETFKLTLSTDSAAVQALTPGVYDLVGASAGGKNFFGQGEGEAAPVRVLPLILEPGDVVYAGRLLLREEVSKDKTKTRLVIEVGSDEALARSGLQLNYPNEIGRLKVKLLKVGKG
jgi:hypothetical protein